MPKITFKILLGVYVHVTDVSINCFGFTIFSVASEVMISFPNAYGTLPPSFVVTKHDYIFPAQIHAGATILM